METSMPINNFIFKSVSLNNSMNNIYLNILVASFETINQISHVLIFVLVFCAN